MHEEESRERAVASTVEREKAATAAVKQLKVQLKKEKASHDNDMAQKRYPHLGEQRLHTGLQDPGGTV